MQIQFIPVETPAQVRQLAAMADTVWHEFFPGIISEEQIDYMLAKFQSERALRAQLEEGYQYFFFVLNGIYIGYTGVCVKEKEHKLFLSKLYLLHSYRGKGYATQAFEFLQGLAQAYGANCIYLTVNRRNTHAIEVYQNWGFVTASQEATDIGNSFVMDDYVMEFEWTQKS